METTVGEGAVELATLTESGDLCEPIPLVFIEGWAAGTSAKLFDGLDVLLNCGKSRPDAQNRRILVIKCGAYSSLWDRAHEIYYALRGGPCDYGARHATEHGHARYGRTHEAGLYENWSPSFPLHFAGHSFGGATILFLQQLLRSGVLPGHEEQIRSITTISSPLRGTSLAARLGQLDGPEAGQKRFSVAWMMAVGVHMAKNANVIASDLYDFGADQWTTQESTEGEEKSRLGLMDSFLGYFPSKGMGFSADSAGYDMLSNVMEARFKENVLSPKTFYRSYTAGTPMPLYLPPLAFCHYLVAHEDDALPSEWRDNDGFISVASQMHPKDCGDTTCLHLLKEIAIEEEPPPIPQVWHVRHFEDTTHFGLVDYLWKWRTSSKTRLFWRELGIWLARVDAESETASHEGVKQESVSIRES